MSYDKTEVSISKSQEQIRKLIYSHGGTGLMLVSHPPREGFETMVKIADTTYHLRIMATCKAVSKYDGRGLIRSEKSREAATDQEGRRVWRVLYWHLKAMFEASDSGVIDVRDVVMPYVVLADGRTVADHIVPRMPELMNLDPARLLSGGTQ